MAVMTTLVFISISLALTFLWLKNKFSYWKKRGLESPSFIETVINLKKNLCHEEATPEKDLRIYKWIKSRGLKHAGFYSLWNPQYQPVDLDIIKHILQNDFDHFFDRGMYINEKSDPLSLHLFSLPGKKWKLLRNKLTPTFSSGRMKMMFETVVDCTKSIEKAMDRNIGKPIQIRDIAGRFTTDVIGSCAFGLECNTLEKPDDGLRKKIGALFESTFYQNITRMFIVAFPELMKMLGVKLFNTETNDWFMNLTKETIDYREKNNVHRKDFMDLMIQLKNKGRLVDEEQKQVKDNVTDEENKITIEEIAAQCFIFFGAGYETSSATISFCLYELAKNSGLQDKVRNEIKKVMTNHGGTFKYECLAEMKYLEQCINETLRKYPPESHLLRMCTKEYQIPNTDLIIEKGTKVFINSIGLQRDPDNYPEPEKFDPDRFSPENLKNRPPCSFLAFGQGPRNCIGLRFGMMQTKIGLVSLLLNYEFSPSEKTKEPFKFDPDYTSLVVTGGLWLNFNKISSVKLTN